MTEPPITIVHGPGVLAEEPVIQTAPPPTKLHSPTGRRRLVETAVLFLIAILFLRTTAVEPFGVPTGSMAPTLSGNHKALACPRCNFPVRVGEPLNSKRDAPEVRCPNCGAANLDVAAATAIAGDRLLVDKNVFRLRSPRRWEVGVFICPSDTSKPYVKRVVGLPNERIQLRDGDVWINGELARKTLAEARECRVPVWNADFVPPEGWRRRWWPAGEVPPVKGGEPPALPDWLAVAGRELTIRSAGDQAARLAAYWHVPPDTPAPAVLRDGFEYNGSSPSSREYAVHDFLVEFEAEVAGTGSIIVQLTDGSDEATAHLSVGGTTGESRLVFPPPAREAVVTKPSLQPGQKHTIEMAHVDRRVTVRVNGEDYFTHDLPPVDRRTDVTSPFRIGAKGVTMVVRHLKLYRDVYYRPGDRHAGPTPYQLGADEYFLLGDNSANSDDSRSWQIPGVPERNFLGKPFLLHQPSRPAGWAVGGRRVQTQTIDWDRIRWLR
jgi:signal peptidase I